MALLPPPEHHEALEEIEKEAKKKFSAVLPKCSWVKPAQLHLTMHFYGDLKTSQRERLIKSLDEIAPQIKTPIANPSHLGCFPNPGRPRVLWVGLEPGEPFSVLSHACEEATENAQLIREERPFKAHITLCRIRQPQPLHGFADLLENFFMRPFQPLPWPQLVLFDSRLSPQGAEHTPLKTWNLSSGD